MVMEIAFVRVSSNSAVPHGISPRAAHVALGQIRALAGHFFASEPATGYGDAVFASTMANTLTHHFVSDAYLATLAAMHGVKLATLDRQLGKLFPAVALI